MTRHWQMKAYQYGLACLGLWIGTIRLFTCPAQAQNPVIGTPYVSNPAGTLTGPPSASQSGLVEQQSSFANSANLLITGDVGGAKHFRASVPYQSGHDFHGPLGSSYLDSFLRVSQDPSATTPLGGTYTPYYSLNRLVTRTLPGRTDILSPVSVKRTSGLFTGASGDTSIDLMPLPLRTVDVPVNLAYPLPNIGYAGDLLSLELLANTLYGEGQSDVSAGENIQALSWLFGREQNADMDAAQAQTQTAEPGTETGQFASTDMALATESALSGQDQRAETLDLSTTGQRVTPLQLMIQLQAEQPQEIPGFLTAESPEPLTPDTMPEDGAAPSPTNTSVPNETTYPGSRLPAGGTLAAYSWVRYSRFMHDAESHLKQGRFAQAISAYKLATIHSPNDPLAAAGRSHALFAQAEFTSSALFLRRALAGRPDYAEFLIDLAALMGGEEAVHQRMRELERFLSYNGSADLQFLLAYISYQINDLSRAREFIQAAQKKQPDDQAVLVLQKVIQKAL